MKKRNSTNKYDKRLTEEAEHLNKYLHQYGNCIKRKRALERRKEEIIKEFENPLSGACLDGMPKGNNIGVGCAAISLMLEDIKIQIDEQTEKAAMSLSGTMEIIDFLPQNTIERSIIENKYIDRFNWDKVCAENNISRTPATRQWKKGLYKLLEFEKVKQILHDQLV